MKTSRRQLIRMGLCATASLVACFEGLAVRAAFAAVPDRWANVPDGQAPTDDGVWLRRDLFETRVGEAFTAQTPRFGGVALSLERVEDCLSARNAGTVNSPDCFTLVLRGHASTPLVQGTYLVASMTLGTFLLFLVPGPVMGSSITYAATFNRLGNELNSTFR
jgi:hypothetical protein